MATWKKSPPELIAAFDSALAGQPHAQRRQMFGYPCAFVNGHMAVGLHEDRVIARVPAEAERHPCLMLGRRMKEYAAVGFDDVMAPGAMARWVARAVEYTATMAPKAAKKKAKDSKPAAASAAASGTKKAARKVAAAAPVKRAAEGAAKGPSQGPTRRAANGPARGANKGTAKGTTKSAAKSPSSKRQSAARKS
jgi:hypothetical protein